MSTAFPTKIEAFFSSPANRTGLTALGATLFGVVTQVLSKDIALSAGVSAAIFGVARVVDPQGGLTEADVQAIVADGIALYHGRSVEGAVSVAQDVAKAVADAKGTQPPTVVVTTLKQSA